MKLVRTVSTLIESGFRIIKTKIGSNIIETSKQVGPFGFDSNVPGKYVAIMAETISNEDPVIIGYLNLNVIDSLATGESMIFPTDDKGALKASIIMRADGTTEIIGSEDNAVRYSKLETAYDELKGKVNDLVTAFNQHLHPTAAVGPPSPPTPVPNVIPALPSAGDITGAKIDEIKTN